MHVPHKEFRFGHEDTGPATSRELALTAHADSPLPSSLIQNVQFLRELLLKKLAEGVSDSLKLLLVNRREKRVLLMFLLYML